MMFVGIDSGSTYTKIAFLNQNLSIEKLVLFPTCLHIDKEVELHLKNLGLDVSSASIVATGYCRKMISSRFNCASITEIKALAIGASFLFPRTKTLIDVGGQDSKVIKLNGKGGFASFAMNDKCAAGTGRFIEMLSLRLGVSLEELDRLAERSSRPVNLSSMCAVFADSEIVSLMARGESSENIAAAVVEFVAKKAVSLAKSIGVEGDVILTGGLSGLLSFKKSLERLLKTTVNVPENARYFGAIGAAIYSAKTKMNAEDVLNANKIAS